MRQEQGIDIVFRDVYYTVMVEDKEAEQSCFPCFKKMAEKHLLKGVSGIFKSGQLTAIMGASGAGKTTLLNLLACRLPQSQTKGSITANGEPYNFDSFGDFANYVMQQDVLIQTLTVRETLDFAAKLKLNASDSEMKSIIERLLYKFKLEKCQHTLVGGLQIKGISGG